MAAYLPKVDLLFKLKRFADAERELRDALADDPNDALAHSMLAVALSRLKKLPEALRESESAVGLDPTNARIFFARSLVLIAADRSDEALCAVREAVQLDTASNADYFMMLAALLFDKKEWEHSLAAADRGLSIDPHHVTCLIRRGDALLRLGRFDDAETALTAALAAQPGNAGVHRARGLMFLKRSQAGNALDHLVEARRLDPLARGSCDSIALAIGWQLIPFRWFDRGTLHWNWWQPKIRRAFFLLLIAVYVALSGCFPTPGRESPAPAVGNHSIPVVFGLAVVIAMLAPFTLDVLASSAAWFVRPKTVGADWKTLLDQLFFLAIYAASNLIAIVLATQPAFVLLALSLGAFGDVIKRRLWGQRRRIPKEIVQIFWALAAAALLVIAMVKLMTAFPLAAYAAWFAVVGLLQFVFKTAFGRGRRSAE
jgi:tetratricopeptide (TPR) repeat protein